MLDKLAIIISIHDYKAIKRLWLLKSPVLNWEKIEKTPLLKWRIDYFGQKEGLDNKGKAAGILFVLSCGAVKTLWLL
jgi:hypothetical protein